jgi:hypothetical protein
MCGKKNAVSGGFHGKAACLIACVSAFLFLLPGCGKTPTLKVEVTNAKPGMPPSFRFVDTSTGEEIFYTTLVFKGKKVYKALGTSQGVYFAFDESQYRVEGNTTRFDGGVMITPAGAWKYTLTDAPGCKPGVRLRSRACELAIRSE